jgi:hypothetical protein
MEIIKAIEEELTGERRRPEGERRKRQIDFEEYCRLHNIKPIRRRAGDPEGPCPKLWKDSKRIYHFLILGCPGWRPTNSKSRRGAGKIARKAWLAGVGA